MSPWVTIVLAAGVTRGWRSAWTGVATALVALAAIVAVLGPALTALPINVLRVVVGGLLLVFGLQGLRKAILRGSGFKALHDEDAIFAEEVAELRVAGEEKPGIDPFGFTVIRHLLGAQKAPKRVGPAATPRSPPSSPSSWRARSDSPPCYGESTPESPPSRSPSTHEPAPHVRRLPLRLRHR